MAATPITPAPFLLKNVSLLIGPTDTNFEFAKAVDAVTFTPSASTVSWTGLGGNTFTDVTTATWACALSYPQDWDDEDSLSRYLHEHEGEQVACTFKPKSAGTPSVTATLVITPGAIGGTVNQVAVATVTLGVIGKPVIV
jgi:hypothetical protein